MTDQTRPTTRRPRLKHQDLPRVEVMRLQPHRLAAGQRRSVDGYATGTRAKGKTWKAPWRMAPTDGGGWRLLIARPNADAQAVDLLPEDQGPGRAARWWFACPACQGRRGVLFLAEGCWACRGCHRVGFPCDGHPWPAKERDRERRWWENRWAMQDAADGPPDRKGKALRAYLRSKWDRWPGVRRQKAVPSPLPTEPARDHPLGGDPQPFGLCAPGSGPGETVIPVAPADGPGMGATACVSGEDDLPVVIIDDTDPATLPIERAALVLAQDGSPNATQIVRRLRGLGFRGRSTKLYALAHAAGLAVVEIRHPWWRQEAARRKAPALALVAADLLNGCRTALSDDPRWQAVFTALDHPGRMNRPQMETTCREDYCLADGAAGSAARV